MRIDRDKMVALLDAEWAAIGAVLDELAEPDWSRPTALPGWTVADVVAHVIGTERMLAGDPTPDPGRDLAAEPHVHNPIAATNEAWVEALRSDSPAAVRSAYASVIARRRAQLGVLDQTAFDAPSWTPVGQATYGRFMQIRLFDCWVHEQDIRHATDRPGGDGGPAAEQAVDEVERALGFIIGKRAQAPDGTLVTIALHGPVERTTHVLVDSRASVVAEPDRPSTTTLRLDSTLFMRLATGRTDAESAMADVAVEGDADLARRVAANLSFTI